MIRNNDSLNHRSSYNYIHYNRLGCSSHRLWRFPELVLMRHQRCAPTQHYNILLNLVAVYLLVFVMLFQH
jgi:hypothetical protein